MYYLFPTVIILIGLLILSIFIYFSSKRGKSYSFKVIPFFLYKKYYLLPDKNKTGIYNFLDSCIDSFALTPDKVYSYLDGYVCLWRGYGSGYPVGLDKKSVVIIITTNNDKLLGHVRNLRLDELSKGYKHLENGYYLCLPHKDINYYISCFYINKIKLITKNFSENGWNFVFYNGQLAVYKKSYIFKESEIRQIYKLLSLCSR